MKDQKKSQYSVCSTEVGRQVGTAEKFERSCTVQTLKWDHKGRAHGQVFGRLFPLWVCIHTSGGLPGAAVGLRANSWDDGPNAE